MKRRFRGAADGASSCRRWAGCRCGCLAGTTCRMPSRLLPSASSSGSRSSASRRGSQEFRGVERRFEVLGEPNGILVVDDYGHHPTEIAAALDAARVLKRRLIVAFQPHRYSRTAALMDAFGPAFAAADHVVLTDIYAAGENPIADVTVDALAAAIRRGTGAPVDVVPALDDLVPALARIARPGDVVITLGAGSIGSVSRRLLDALAASPIPATARREPAHESSGHSGRPTLPARARQAGASSDGTGATLIGRTIRFGLVAGLLLFGGYRGAGIAAHVPRAPDRTDRRARQRAALERGSAGGSRRSARARASCGPIWTSGAAGCCRRRGSATRTCGARCPRRWKSSCRSDIRSASGA